MNLTKTAITTVSVLLVIFIAGCRKVDNVVYSRIVCFDRNGWDPMVTPAFNPWPGDSTDAVDNPMNVDIVARYSKKCAIESLPLAVETEDETGQLGQDTIILNLKEGKTDPFGITESKYRLLERYQLRPGFSILLTSLIDREDTEGLLSIGVMMTDGAPSILDQIAKYKFFNYIRQTEDNMSAPE